MFVLFRRWVLKLRLETPIPHFGRKSLQSRIWNGWEQLSPIVSPQTAMNGRNCFNVLTVERTFKSVIETPYPQWIIIITITIIIDSISNDMFKLFSLRSRYNNQWMVVDYKKFTPGKPVQPGTLTVLEEIPYVAAPQRVHYYYLFFHKHLCIFNWLIDSVILNLQRNGEVWRSVIGSHEARLLAQL